MTWTKVNAAATSDKPVVYPKYKELYEAGVPEGGLVIAEGLLTNTDERPNNFDASKIDVTYYIEQDDNVVGLNKAGNLGYLLEKANLTPDSLIRVTYVGMEKIEKGPMAGRLSHTFELEVKTGE